MVFVELLIILLLVVLNGIFAMSEMAVVSAKRIKLLGEAENGNRLATRALALVDTPQSFLSTVQIGITLIGILAGVYGGATVAGTLEGVFAELPLVAAYSGPLSYALVIGTITYLSLIIGELLPKRLALSNPEKIAKVVARPMGILATLFRPLITFVDWSTEKVFTLVPLKAVGEYKVTEEEIRVMLSQGTAAGILEHEEEEILYKVLKLDDKPASIIMTPRTELTWIDISHPEQDNLEIIADNPYSFFPVGDGSLDEIVGVLSVQELAAALIRQQEKSISNLMRPPVKIPASLSGLQILERFKSEKTEVALVVDEYGSVSGLLTVHDLMEALVGSLPTGHDEEPEYLTREDGSILVEARMDIEELFEVLKLSRVYLEDTYYHSVGGFIMERLGHIPRTGDTVEYESYIFEVIDMDRQRIDKVLVRRRL